MLLGAAEFSLHSCPTISLDYVSFHLLVAPLNTSPGEDRMITSENKKIVFKGLFVAIISCLEAQAAQ